MTEEPNTTKQKHSNLPTVNLIIIIKKKTTTHSPILSSSFSLDFSLLFSFYAIWLVFHSIVCSHLLSMWSENSYGSCVLKKKKKKKKNLCELGVSISANNDGTLHVASTLQLKCLNEIVHLILCAIVLFTVAYLQAFFFIFSQKMKLVNPLTVWIGLFSHIRFHIQNTNANWISKNINESSTQFQHCR